MSCIQITQSMVLDDMQKFETRLFKPGERYETTGDPIVKQVSCGCTSGEVEEKVFYPIQAGPNSRNFQIDQDFLVVVDCDTQVVAPQGDLIDRLNEINSNPVDPRTNESVDFFPENRDDLGRLKEFNRAAVFDLRKR